MAPASLTPFSPFLKAPRMRATLRILKWQMKIRCGALKNVHLGATRPPGYPLGVISALLW